MRIPKTEEERILVCNAALTYYHSGSFSDAYDVCETSEEEDTVTEYKEVVEALEDCMVDVLLDYMEKLENFPEEE